MDDSTRDSVVPASRPRGPLSSRPAPDRATPVADPSIDYSAYIAASASSKVQARTTMRIEAGDLDRLVQETRRTGSLRRPSPQAIAVRMEAESPTPPPRAIDPADLAPTSRLRVLGALAGLAVLAGGALLFVLPRVRVAPSSPAPAEAAGTIAPPSPASEPPAGVATSTAAPGPQPAESQARAALERLRAGLGECIRHGIHGLPGSSPAVPPTLASLKGGPYRAAPAEWKTAVWSCARFQMAEGMAFQLQWQLVKPGVDGLALAWIDTDADGVADRALGFHITLGARGEPVLGEIQPIPPSHPPVLVR